MLRVFFKFLFWLTGWKIQGALSQGLTKCVIIVAPHTSYIDFYLGVATRAIHGFRASYLVKQELFKYAPVAWFVRITGGIAVDRKNKKNNVVDHIVKLFEERDYLILALAPEGTRKPVEQLKTGFYRIASKANVPVVIVAFDYATKTVKFVEEFLPTGNMEEDILHITDMYRGIPGRHPELSIK